MYVLPCPRHPMFKDRFRNDAIDISCKCLEQSRGYCNNCKTKCFTLNFIADKVKISQLLDVPDDVQFKTIDNYLKETSKVCCFFIFAETA